ncbi:hypothetical protein CO112_00800 [Candidatus Dojkabacteria bacterium CG_4_9_14_3_um_filter_150_Dojkabacteria_WS6_41_13]|uniref:Uncharacterized protein n=1 Tax=Candidatus Dojkabacteria bacterium CG_4_10_14_0_2_um_filter_Dojkabacteria_WS6_41_15 TaxID=2014249 RepID=A0A2M7W2U4_9BACT|nr:MAG: hypothetical protein COZ14_02335 [Candidatus Dojkabacteria bacterium CG_4_10_14_3_um_filter_Dojkabacteria_WS6_41_9]PJA15196.1 MAG: hypothetical protein COX64_00990 [Candidatus Dojkabacteria bacterium CG_4_10_14_0_2_um_filter_Dojkabacteria_WS6_41_15]PJB23513.1 MAG: hypothetical protein CO112_00800 [Candidatus Dojkabacteria bacterium CG_4_9_14_3_um_filter_150_Dojkabacteria_WS6_41_13]
MTNKEARSKLLKLYKLDQKYREKWEMGREIWKLQGEIDKQNMVELNHIVEELSWPIIPKVGEKAALAAILIAQHSRDFDNSVKFLAMAMQLYKEDKANIDGKRLTNWVDAMNVQRKIPQVYGQYLVNRGNGYEIYDIVDPKNLDIRRADMGLESFDLHFEKIFHEHSENKDSLMSSYKKIFGKEFTRA